MYIVCMSYGEHKFVIKKISYHLLNYSSKSLILQGTPITAG